MGSVLIAPGWVVADREYWYPGYSQAHLSRERVDQGDYCISRFKRPSNAQDLLETYISMGEEQDSVAFSRAVWAKIGKIASVHVGQYCKIVTLLLSKRIALPSGHNAISRIHRTWRKFETSFSHTEIRFCRVCLGLQSDWAMGFFVLYLNLNLKLFPEWVAW